MGSRSTLAYLPTRSLHWGRGCDAAETERTRGWAEGFFGCEFRQIWHHLFRKLWHQARSSDGTRTRLWKPRDRLFRTRQGPLRWRTGYAENAVFRDRGISTMVKSETRVQLVWLKAIRVHRKTCLLFRVLVTESFRAEVRVRRRPAAGHPRLIARLFINPSDGSRPSEELMLHVTGDPQCLSETTRSGRERSTSAREPTDVLRCFRW
jgi:hypothetical protein